MSHKKKNQHTVPRFLLQNFTEKSELKDIYTHINILDKNTRRTFKTPIGEATTRKWFYDSEVDDSSHEEDLGELEGRASAVIRKLTSGNDLRDLSSDEINSLKLFIATQNVRTTAMKKIVDGMLEKIESFAPFMFPLTDGERKGAFLKMIEERQHFAESISNRTAVLLRIIDEESNFYISDNPVNLVPLEKPSAFLGYGLKSVNTTLYFPISNKVALSLLCSETMDNLYNRFQYLISKVFVTGKGNDLSDKEINDFWAISKIFSGHALQASKSVIDNINTAQVICADRHIMSVDGDFTFANQVLSELE